MKQFLDLGKDILKNGRLRGDRTGTGRLSVFGRQTRYYLPDDCPVTTSKLLYVRQTVEELLWMLSGSTDNNELLKKKTTIWNEWALKDGRLGPIYGEQWRSWKNANVEAVPYPLDMRMALALAKLDDYNHPTQTKIIDRPELKYNGDQLIHLQRMIGLGENPNVLKHAHEQLNKWDIPVGEPVVKTIDQIAIVRDNLINNPLSSRHVITAWNPSDLPDEKLSPHENVRRGKASLASCHCLFQFYCMELTLEERWDHAPKIDDSVPGDTASLMAEMDRLGVPKYRLDCQLYQRSADWALGVPFNILSYSLLTMMMAQVCNMVPGEFIHTFGDLHIYANHIEKAKEQVERIPFALPTMKINPEVKDIFGFKWEDFTLVGYDHHPKIEYAVSV
jgi:thymidylate synthase